MKKIVSLIICTLLTIGAVMAQQMSDKQVVEYIQSAMEQGKNQKQIATELAMRGVSKEQAMRIQQQFGSQATATSGQNVAVTKNRLRHTTEDQDAAEQGTTQSEVKTIQDEEMFTTEDLIDIETPDVEKKVIFGRNIFNTRHLTFAPNQNIATPANYKLGPGDQVIIDIWGANQTTISQVISPDGYISIDNLGLVYLNNMSITEAEKYLRKRLSSIYASVGEENTASEIKVTLGQIRTIKVHVMGEVVKAGTYSLSSFSTAFYALYHAGGVNDLGSLRNISVVRNGKQIAVVDVYDFILKGQSKGNISLQDGDAIIVPPYHSLVEVDGNVKRPMFYEMAEGETLNTLLGYAGDFTGDAYRKSVTVTRKNGREYQIHTVDDDQYSAFALMDGDKVEVGRMIERFENRIEVKGAVYREGVYQLSENLNTVSKLVNKAEGIMDDAFLARAVLHRERPDLTLELIQVDLGNILNGTAADITLQKNDVLYIPSIHDLKDIGTITVMGEVANPGVFPYADNATLEDMIILAGGLLESASSVRVDISRRIVDAKNTEAKETIGEQFTFALKDGLVVDGDKGFILKPYDQIFVRKSPTYHEQNDIIVRGEVLYGGTYSLTKKAERLSDIIARAGGITPFAYPKGARLVRTMNEEELQRAKDVIALAKRNQTDSLDMNSLNLYKKFTIGIDLEKAISNPGSDADVVLRAGDELIIPELNNTVRMSGMVMYPNTVSFAEGKPMKYYIEQAGGFAQQAKKRKTYIVYMNGQVKRGKLNSVALIEPGCEIIVPMREKNAAALQNILSIATTSASLATMIASIANIIK